MKIENAYPLSKLQEGMIFHSEKEANGVYHDIFVYSYQGEYNFEKICQCFQMISDQNPVLRTSFQLDKFSEPLQIVKEKFPVHIVEFSNLSDEALEKRLQEYIDRRKKISFDWEKDPLWKIGVFKGNDSQFIICLDFHHSILDGWSVATLMQVFTEYYLEMLQGRQPKNFFSMDSGYDAFIKLERESINSREDRDFWRKEIQESNYLSLIPDESPKARRSIVSVKKRLDSVVVERLKEVSRDLKVPLKILCLAAHLKLLSLLSDEKKVTTGIVSNGRAEIDGENVLGLFLNTIPFTLELERINWEKFLTKVFNKEKNLIPYRRYPLSEMINTCNCGKPLFDVVFNYVDFHVYQEKTVFNNLFSLRDVKVIEKTNFPLAIQFVNNPIDGGLTLSIIYDEEKFGKSYIENALDLIVTSLEELEPDVLITENMKIFSRQTDDISIEVNMSGSMKENKVNLPLFLEKLDTCVKQYGDNVAVIDPEKETTYTKLDESSSRLASYLLSIGVIKGDKVGVYLDRSLNLVIAIIALWKIGAVYVPLDRRFPKKRMEFIIKDLGIKSVLVSGIHSRVPLAGLCEQIIIEESFDTNPKTISNDVNNQEELAYVIYTSGTTGTPKGVCVSHRGIANLINHYQYNKTDRVLMTFNIAFDGCLFDILISLASGAALCVPTHKNLVGDTLAKDIKNYKVSLITLTPTVLLSLEFQKFNSLKMISVAGEKCSIALAKIWGEAYKFRNLYGPSEGTISATEYEFQSERDKDLWILPIGKPISNVQVYILDKNLQLIPKGTVGEICISGENLAIGYTDENETRQKFKVNIFNKAHQLNKKFYLTGDRGKVDDDGNLVFVGREDGQVKVNGIRMELSEIESRLEGYSNIKKAIIRVENRMGSDRILAYLLLTDESEPSQLIDQINDSLKEYLPTYMIPSEFRIMESLPQDFNGKIDAHDLESRSRKVERKVDILIKPRNQSEQFVHNLICQTLSYNEISVFENIIELGCNSLMVLKINKKINMEYQIEMPIQDIFDNPTIEKISIKILQHLIRQAV